MRRLVVALALMLVACSDDSACDTFDEITDRLTEPPPAEYQAEMTACVAYLKRCVAVCEHLLADYGHAGEMLTECMVMHDATGHDITFAYAIPCAH